MELSDALAVLGVVPGAAMDEVRVTYRRLVRAAHPDVDTAGDATARTARITAAFATVRAAVLDHDGATVPVPPSPPVAPPPAPPGSRLGDRVDPQVPIDPFADDIPDADVVDGDTIAITAPPPEAFARLLDAAAAIGGIGYVDRHLGLLEVLVRFEGGPTCSVLVTLQGRAHVTEAFCTMESIEAAPTPPLRPVVEALVDALRNPA